jgi:predicted nuclease of restriction endonuclease-like (RecB) superfamily
MLRGKRSEKPGREITPRSGGFVQPPVARLPAGYAALLEDLKARIHQAQVKAAFSVNRELIALYWYIGRSIVQRQQSEGWGRSVIDRLSADIQAAFSGIAGFSPSNISRMRAFYLAYAQETPISAQPVPKSKGADSARPVPEMSGARLPGVVECLPWGHNVVLLFKIKDPVRRLWYAQQTIEHGWSRNVLVHQIESGLFERQGRAITNFQVALPSPQSDLAAQVLKDPYNFDFLTLASDAREKELEQGLLDHLQRFLLELGKGFAFVGRQVPLEVDDEDFYLDLLFYHLGLRCYVVIDLKTGPFKPEYAGKMNFYLSAVDDRFRHPEDRPSIGLILCKDRDRVIVEYTLRGLAKPIGVSAYRITRSLPKAMKGSLPTIEELEAELSKTGRRKSG